ncbi:methyltransferase [Brevibacillus brevis]|uniref:Methyltransferase n=2 Tax=Brevibacillus brevis TaxID=1393 RepID=A0A2Z4MRS9_BREBE|nr:methyltransferase [Brevibacillus brevis]
MGFEENKHFFSIHEIFPENYPYEEIKPRNDYAPWKEDELFKETYNQVENYTLVDIYRAYTLWSLVEQVSKCEEGVFIEIGVWKGGTGALIAKKAELLGLNENVYLCDTFLGVVKADSKYDTVYRGGEHNDTSEEIVRDLIENRMQLKRVNILRGVFPDDSHDKIMEKKVRLCHIDVDVYLSAAEIFDWVWERITIGGVVIFDDYGFMFTEGITKLVNQLKHRNDLLFIYNHSGQAVFVKTS